MLILALLLSVFTEAPRSHAGALSLSVPMYIFNNKGQKIPDLLSETNLVAWKMLSAARDDAYNGVGRVHANGANCTGALIHVGNDPSAPAYVLTAGHCFLRGLGRSSLSPDDIATDQRVIGTFEPGAFSDAPARPDRHIEIRRFVYATMKSTDVALIELKARVGELVSRGFHFYDVSGRYADAGTEVEIAGVPVHGMSPQLQYLHLSRCFARYRMNRELRISGLGQKKYHWERGLGHDCSIMGGMSGGPMFLPGTHEIVGIVSSGPSLEDLLDDLTEPVLYQFADYNLAAYPGDVPGCFRRDGRFDLAQPSCTLEKPCSGNAAKCAAMACAAADGRGCFDSRDFERGCALGESRSCRELGARQATAGSLGTAKKNLESACEGGDGRACGLLGAIARKPELGAQACAMGDGQSCGTIARESGDLTMLAKACFYTDAESCAQIGELYEAGSRGLPRSAHSAKSFFGYACELGWAPTCAKAGNPGRRGD